MHIRIKKPVPGLSAVSIENNFDFLSVEYEQLFRRSVASAFQSPLWLHSFYSVLVPRLGAKPHIIVVRDAATAQLQMVIPLAIQRYLGIGILQPADLGVSDYNSIVADDATLLALSCDKALTARVRKLTSVADVLIFRKIRNAPEAIAAMLGSGRQTRNENEAYEIDLAAGTYDDWQKTKLKKKFRCGTNKRLASLNAAYKSVEFVTFTSRQDIETAIRFIGEQRSSRFDDDILSQDGYLDFYLHHALAGAESGQSVTSGMMVDGALVSANFGIVSNHVYHSILCGARIEDFKDYAPGLQSILAIVRRRIELGEMRFDFGIGKSRHKTDLGSVEQPLYNLTVAGSISGRAVALVYNRAKPLKTLLRKKVGWIR